MHQKPHESESAGQLASQDPRGIVSVFGILFGMRFSGHQRGRYSPSYRCVIELADDLQNDWPRWLRNFLSGPRGTRKGLRNTIRYLAVLTYVSKARVMVASDLSSGLRDAQGRLVSVMLMTCLC